MTVFMVERQLDGISMEELATAQKAAIATSADFTRQGRRVSYIRSTFVPNEGACMCLFEGDKAEDVAAVNEAAGIPFTRVVEALDLKP